MAKVFIEESSLTAIGEAIRSKTGKSELLSPASMASEITSITTGGGGDIEEIVLTGNCEYACANPGWNAVFNKVRTENVSNAEYMFKNNNTAEYIPFDINLSPNCTYLRYVFEGMSKLKKAPLIKGDLSGYGTHICSLFASCSNLREIPYDFFHNFGGETFWANAVENTGYRQNMFQYCNSLRKLPDIRMLRNAYTSSSRNLYQNICGGCYALDEITNLPVTRVNLTSNMFNSSFNSCARIKDFTFETDENGQPIVVTWSKQTIDLTWDVGYKSANPYQMVDQAGLTYDKKITDDATYQALKNDEDAWAELADYSRYDKASVLRTINTLPDCSGGTGNTIKFKGTAGAKTDGGAINTLTEEEIAMATAKGWTISFV